VLDQLYARIPQNRRVSYGRVHTIKVLSEHLYRELQNHNASVFEIGYQLFESCQEIRSKGVALGILSYHGLIQHQEVLPCFTEEADSPEWEVREFAQMFFRKLIKKYPHELRQFLLVSVKSEKAHLRRFVAETLRPVQENQWIYANPEYSVSILRHLFAESKPYPRTSVGNNLSDLARRLPDLVYTLVKELVGSGNENSYWIAYRACRNLVKTEPLKVMDLLRIDEYRYKKRVYRRRDQSDQ
jgi:3-methyladenine DNA glycosylase AlkC